MKSLLYLVQKNKTRDSIKNCKPIKSLFLIVILSLSNICQPAKAATITSTSSGGDWNLPSTWTGGVIPGSGDDVVLISDVTVTAGDIRTCNTIKYNATKVINNNGSLTVNGGITGTGSIVQGPNAILRLRSTNSATINATAAGNTVEYFSSANQPIKPTTYYKLKCSNSDKTFSGSTTVKDSLISTSTLNCNGTLIVNGNATLANTYINNTITVEGNTTVNGTFTSTVDQADIYFNGDLIINGTWDNELFTSNFHFKKNLINNNQFNAGNGMYIFDGETELQSVNSLDIANIEINGSVTNKVYLYTESITGLGTFTNDTNATLNYLGSSIEPTLIATAPNNEVIYYAADAFIKATTYSTLSLYGYSANTKTAEGNISATTINIGSNTTLNMDAFQLADITNQTGSGNIITKNTSSIPLPTGKTWGYAITYNGTGAQTVVGGTYSTLNLDGGNTKNLDGAIALTNLTITGGTSFNLGTQPFPTCTHTGSGTILTQNTSTAPLPSGETWSYTINYNGTTTQNLVNGTYSNVIIDNTAGVAVSDSATISNTLTINSGKKLTIGAAKSLTAQTIINNGGSAGLSILASETEPSGTLIFHNNGTNVPATVQMYTKAYAATNNNGTFSNYKWQFFGIPVSSLTANPTFNNSYLRKYNEAGTGTGSSTGNRWINVASGATLTAFTGYEITQPVAKTISISGNLVNSDYNSGKLSVTPTAEYPGQHLIGNPYTAAIYIPSIQFGSSSSAIIENTIYLYNTGTYSEWTNTGSGSTSGESAGQYTVIPKNTAGTGGIPSKIAPMQAFLVAAVADNAAATVTIPYSSVAKRNTVMLRSIQKQNSYLRIKVSGTRFSDNTWIILSDNCTTSYDNGWDGYKMGGSTVAPQLWAQEGNDYLQIDSKNAIDNTILGFYKGEDSNYTLTFTHSEDEPQFASLYLTDLYTNSITDISQSGSSYSFTANDNVLLNRFKISTSPDTPTENNSLKNSFFLYNVGKTIYLHSNENTSTTLTITDLSGKTILNSKLLLLGKKAINTNLNSGIYIVTATGNNEKITKRIIIP